MLLPVLLSLSVGGGGHAAAQEAIASDRPGIGSGAFVLGPGTIQLETGFERSRSNVGSRTTAYSFGQALVRVGFSSLELDVFLNSLVVVDRDAADSQTGLQDAGVGVKVPFLRGDDGPVTLALQGAALLPTGSEAFSTPDGSAVLNALADIALGERAAVSVNVGHQRLFGPDVGVTSVIVTPAVSLGSGFGAYGGWAGSFTDDATGHLLEAGLTYVPGPDLQLDLNGGSDASSPSEGWFLGFGVATRWGGR